MNLRQAISEKTNECLTIDGIAALAEGLLPEQDAASARAHIASCPTCDAEFAIAARCLTEPEINANTAWVAARLESRLPFAKPQHSWWRRLFTFSPGVSAGFAAACAALALVAWLGQRPSDPGFDPSEASGAAVLRSSTVQLIAPEGDLAAAPAEFSWAPTTGADLYVFQLLEVDGNVLHRAETSATRLATPAAVKRFIVPAKTLLWKVTAMRQGSEIASATAVRFRVKP